MERAFLNGNSLWKISEFFCKWKMPGISFDAQSTHVLFHVTITDVNDLFPDWFSLLLTNFLWLKDGHDSGIHYKQSACLLFNKVMMFLLFLFNKSSVMDAAWKTEFFAYVISRKRKANQREKIQGNVFLFNSKPHAKIQALLRKKKEKTQNRHLGAFSTSIFNY